MIVDHSAIWPQAYDPAHRWWLSTFWAALPLLLLLVLLAGFKIKAHAAALIALATALVVAATIFHMPAHLALLATVLGAGYGLFPIFWIIFPVIFMYQLTVRAGRFKLLHECLVGVTEDSRLQLLLIAFLFGAFFEGAAGFGTPVAVCGTILLGLGFSSLEAAGLALLANTAPVAFGALGIPVVALAAVTGLNTLVLTHVIAALLTPFCLLVPFWLIWVYAGYKAMMEIWPAILVAGATFGGTQLLIAMLHGPWLVDITAAVVSLTVFVLFLKVWKPKRILNAARQDVTHLPSSLNRNHANVAIKAAVPWVILTLCVAVWGAPKFTTLDRFDQHDQDSDTRSGSRGLPHAPSGGRAHAGGRGLHVQLVFGYGHGNLYRRADCGCNRRTQASRNRQGLLADSGLHAFHDDYDCRADEPGLHHSVLWSGCNARTCVCENRRPLSVLRDVSGMAGDGFDRLRYLVECALRQPAEIYSPAIGYIAFSNGLGQLRRWCDGQDDRPAERSCCEHRHKRLWQRGQYHAVRFSA